MKKLTEMLNFDKEPPVERMNGVVVEKDDPVVKILRTCIKKNKSQASYEEKLKRLVDRINLDRPIL